LLDLFSGAGGAAMGYHRAGFDVVGVDNRPQPRYPFEFRQADALEFCRAHGGEFDAIHASPPCQAYSRETPASCKARHPDLIGVTREALRSTGRPYVIENVEDARRLLIQPIRLCGTLFGLPIWRHRYFEAPCLPLVLVHQCDHSRAPVLITGTARRKGIPRREASAATKRAALGAPWMTTKEMDEAIPPAYTEFVGRQLLEALR
jgi:DNA (cytosine-5)-methyltransferase 1